VLSLADDYDKLADRAAARIHKPSDKPYIETPETHQRPRLSLVLSAPPGAAILSPHRRNHRAEGGFGRTAHLD
jgi:hypothetical protein